jgi:chromosome segregation ATPase
VLEYKIAELRKQVEPKEANIASLVHQIQDMNKEMILFERKNEELNGLIEDFRVKIMTKNREYAIEHRRATELTQKMNIIQSDLRKVITKLDNRDALKAQLTDMFHRYQKIAEDPTEYDIQSDKGPQKFDLHSDHLHRTVCDERVRRQFEFSLWGAKNKVRQIRKQRFVSNLRVTEQNVALTSQINHLRTKLDSEKMRLSKITKMIQNEKKNSLGQEGLLPPLLHK